LAHKTRHTDVASEFMAEVLRMSQNIQSSGIARIYRITMFMLSCVMTIQPEGSEAALTRPRNMNMAMQTHSSYVQANSPRDAKEHLS